MIKKLTAITLCLFSQIALADNSPIHYDGTNVSMCYFISQTSSAFDCAKKSGFVPQEFIDKTCHSSLCAFSVVTYDVKKQKAVELGHFYYDNSISLITSVSYNPKTSPYFLQVNNNYVTVTKI